LELRCGRRGHEKLQFHIEDNVPFSFFDDPNLSYSAVSYAAGDHKVTEVISINNRDFNAFRSLANALRRVQDFIYANHPSTGDVVYIWADQICINQSDPDERSYQVEHMRKIYETARNTIIYLGEDTRNGQGMKYLKSIIDYCRVYHNPWDDENWNKIMNRAAEWVLDHVKDPRHTGDWAAIREIFEAPWWRRGWICQEVIVSRDAIILYGDSAIDIAHFTVAAEVFIRAYRNILLKDFEQWRAGRTPDPIVGTLMLDLSHVEFIIRYRQVWKQSPFDDLKQLLRHSRICETGDPRDKVFAFIGLASPSFGIRPDYQSSVGDVFANAAASIMDKEKNLDIMFEAMDNKGCPDLPSWAPEWSLKRERDSVLLRTGSDLQFTASADYPGRAQISFPNKSSTGYGRVIRIEVLNFGMLSIGDTFGPAGEGSVAERLKVWERTAGFRGLELHEDRYIGGGTLEDAFVRTIMLGGWFDDEPYLDDVQGSNPETISTVRKLRKQSPGRYVDNGEWSFFVTGGGYMGLAVSAARHDDYLCIGLGASVPMVLRRHENCYSFVGEAYVHGLMHGEAIELMGSKCLAAEEVDIV
jgi:hypothetical protein